MASVAVLTILSQVVMISSILTFRTPGTRDAPAPPDQFRFLRQPSWWWSFVSLQVCWHGRRCSRWPTRPIRITL